MRLIDADHLSDRVNNSADTPLQKLYVDALLAGETTIDAVPVVRCAECKYWLCVEDGFGDCTNRRFRLDGCADPSMKMDDFCSCGERRSDD